MAISGRLNNSKQKGDKKDTPKYATLDRFINVDLTDDKKIQQNFQKSATDAEVFSVCCQKGVPSDASNALIISSEQDKFAEFSKQQMQKSTQSTQFTDTLFDSIQKNDSTTMSENSISKNSKFEDDDSSYKIEPEWNKLDCVLVKDKKNGKVVEVCHQLSGYTRRIEGDFVVEDPIFKQFIFRYKDKELSCFSEDECKKVIVKVAKLTNRHPSKKALLDAIEYIKKSYTEVTPVCEYVKTNYPTLYEEAEKDIIGFLVGNADRFIHGYEKLRKLVAYSAISAFLNDAYGISKIHLLLIGGSGVGKSTITKSILYQFPDSAMKEYTRITQNFLGYNTDLNAKILFIEQIDGQNINYIRELMSEGKISTGTVEKRENSGLTPRDISINAKPLFVSTSVADDIDIVREQLYNRFFKVYVNPRGLDIRNVIGKIAKRKELEYPFEVKAIVTCFLQKIPKTAEISDEVENALYEFASKVLTYVNDYGIVFRAVEMLRNFVKVHAVLSHKTVADINDFNAIMSEFYNEVLFDALGLTERDIEFLQYVRDAKARVSDESQLPKTDDIVAIAKVHKQNVINVLKNLERKGLVYSEKPDNAFRWGLTELGQVILDFVEKGTETNIQKTQTQTEDKG